MRAEAVAAALAARPDGAVALARALPATRDPERAVLLAKLLRPRAHAVAEGPNGKRLARALVADALARIGRGGAGADATLALARDLDREQVGAGLRALAAKLQKKAPDAALAVLRLVGHAADATADDGYALAAAELRAGRREEALTIVAQLADRGFDLAAALRRDRQSHPGAPLPARLRAGRAAPGGRRGGAGRSRRQRPQQAGDDGQGQAQVSRVGLSPGSRAPLRRRRRCR